MQGESDSVEVGEFSGADEDMRKHGAVQATGVGVAQRRMVAAEQMQAVGQRVLCGVREAVVGAASNDACGEQVGEEAVPRDLAKADDHADAGQRVDLGCEVDGAVANFLRCGLISRGRAANDRGNPGVAEAEAVVAGDGSWLVGEAEFVQNGVHEVSRAIAGEWAARGIGAVGSGGEAEDEDAGAGIAETGDGAGPVFMILVGAAPGFANAGAVVAQAGTELAGDDRVPDAVRMVRRNWKLAQNLRRWDQRPDRSDGRFARDRFHQMEVAGKVALTHTTAA